MYCDQCPEVLSGKGCTKNGPCKKQRDELLRTEKRDREGGLSLTVRLKDLMGVFKKKT
ncbi:hypothetical protein [Methanosarcina horonobensis]|uniref:hypothetical protein n=1 Tax=Methanosarcina horonobensis TaxID=418008 RepID=UPI000AAD0D0D|nr:hypothetical protein [Methanosarcina horonobensis]